jgi:hypothetical protein
MHHLQSTENEKNDVAAFALVSELQTQERQESK